MQSLSSPPAGMLASPQQAMIRSLRFAFAASVAGAVVLPVAAHAQSYPDKPVRIIVPLTAGGGTDTVARTIAREMSDATGQPFLIDNRPDAGGNFACEAVAGARADGHTVQLADAGVDDRIGSTPVEAARFLRAEYERWGKVIRTANIVID